MSSSFSGKSIGELNRFIGRRKGLEKHPQISAKGSFQENEEFLALLKQSEPVGETEDKSRRTVRELPESFDWRDVDGVNYMPPLREQGSCGSCFVFGSIAMAESRFKILTGKDVEFSQQHMLSCNFYTEGCDGGYPMLVGKFAQEFYLAPSSCAPYV